MRITLYRDYKEEGWQSMEVYADNLRSSLQNIKSNIHIQEYVALPWLSQRVARTNKLLRYFFRFIVNPLFSFWHQGEVNHIIDQANVHLLAVVNPQKTVVTCHDLIVPYWVMHNIPQTYKKRIKRIAELWRIGFLKKAARIIAVSQTTKNEIIQTLGIDQHKIVVIPEGVDASFRKKLTNGQIKRITKKYRLPRRYILHVGTTHEYKNMEALLTIFAALRKREKHLFLVKVGTAWTTQQQALIRRLSIEKNILFLGFIPKEDLPYIYAKAVALVHPSHTEGFGFTVLEAMTVGCPVIISDIPALREMAGDAGIYIQPKIKKEDIQHVSKTLHSPTLLYKFALRGKKRAARYTWEKSALLTHRLYKEIHTHHKEQQ